MHALAEQYGFSICKALYAWHYFEAIEGLTLFGGKFVRELTDPSKAINPAAKKRLASLRRMLVTVAFPRDLRIALRRHWGMSKSRWINYAFFIASQPFEIVFWATSCALRCLSENEYHRRRTAPDGAEMYVLFSRRP